MKKVLFDLNPKLTIEDVKEIMITSKNISDGDSYAKSLYGECNGLISKNIDTKVSLYGESIGETIEKIFPFHSSIYIVIEGNNIDAKDWRISTGDLSKLYYFSIDKDFIRKESFNDLKIDEEKEITIFELKLPVKIFNDVNKAFDFMESRDDIEYFNNLLVTPDFLFFESNILFIINEIFKFINLYVHENILKEVDPFMNIKQKKEALYVLYKGAYKHFNIDEAPVYATPDNYEGIDYEEIVSSENIYAESIADFSELINTGYNSDNIEEVLEAKRILSLPNSNNEMIFDYDRIICDIDRRIVNLLAY